MMIGIGMPISQSRTPRMLDLLRFVSTAGRAARGHASGADPARRLVSGRRGAAALLLSLLPLAGGCAQDPVTDYAWGVGDPVRGAALYAPRNLGDTSRWAGDPAGAATAAAQLEFLAAELRTSPRYAPEVNPAVTQALDAARQEMRGHLGIAPDAPTEVVQTGLRRAAEALRAGSRGRAEAALSSPAFAAGPLVTLSRLDRMPRLPRTAEAAGMVAAELARLDRRR
jgi:hypothetical protein